MPYCIQEGVRIYIWSFTASVQSVWKCSHLKSLFKIKWQIIAGLAGANHPSRHIKAVRTKCMCVFLNVCFKQDTKSLQSSGPLIQLLMQNEIGGSSSKSRGFCAGSFQCIPPHRHTPMPFIYALQSGLSKCSHSSLLLGRRGRLRARLEEVPRTLLQVGMMEECR